MKTLTIEQFEEIKGETLLKYGCPEDELWLTECETADQCAKWYGRSYVEELNSHNKKYIVYYHESGSINVTGFFDTMEEFESACEFVARYLK